MNGIESLGYEFTSNTPAKNIIKVLGVGGGGSNAVKFMYTQGIKDVDFIIANTDAQALSNNPVPNRLQLGKVLTSGLGAGSQPETGKQAAEESIDEIKALLNDGTKMAFITAGMGGGTGTGAAPVIASVCRDLGILTVGIVTLPFSFEGPKKLQKARHGIDELKKYCDTVLVIVNDKLASMFGKLSMGEAFTQADSILATAAKSIAEIITVNHEINVDFNDVFNAMKDSGTAVMGSATATGEDRALKAAELAIVSPLLDNREIKGANKVLLSVLAGSPETMAIEEFTTICDFVQAEAGNQADLKFGVGVDPTLGDSIRVTIIATGFQNYDTDGNLIPLNSIIQPMEAPAPVQEPQRVAGNVPPATLPPVTGVGSQLHHQETQAYQPLTAQLQNTAPAAPQPEPAPQYAQPQPPVYQQPVQQPEYQQPVQQPAQPVYQQPVAQQPAPQPVQQPQPQQPVYQQPVAQQPQGFQPQPVQPAQQQYQQPQAAYVPPTGAAPEPQNTPQPTPMPAQPAKSVVTLDGHVRIPGTYENDSASSKPVAPVRTLNEIKAEHSRARLEELRKLGSSVYSEPEFSQLFERPAFERNQMNLNNTAPEGDVSSQKISRLNMNSESGLGENRFLYDNVD